MIRNYGLENKPNKYAPGCKGKNDKANNNDKFTHVKENSSSWTGN